MFNNYFCLIWKEDASVGLASAQALLCKGRCRHLPQPAMIHVCCSKEELKCPWQNSTNREAFACSSIIQCGHSAKCEHLARGNSTKRLQQEANALEGWRSLTFLLAVLHSQGDVTLKQDLSARCKHSKAVFLLNLYWNLPEKMQPFKLTWVKGAWDWQGDSAWLPSKRRLATHNFKKQSELE